MAQSTRISGLGEMESTARPLGRRADVIAALGVLIPPSDPLRPSLAFKVEILVQAATGRKILLPESCPDADRPDRCNYGNLPAPTMGIRP